MKEYAILIDAEIQMFVNAFTSQEALAKAAEHFNAPLEAMMDFCAVQDISNIETI